MGNLAEHPDTRTEPQTEDRNQPSVDRFLVCGLGSLGQHCVRELVAFGVQVSAIDLQPVQDRDVAEIASLLGQLHHGDCRDEEFLREIGIDGFRAILLVTSQDRVNIEAAMTARMLNPGIRVVMRSSKEVLNALLTHEIENFVSFEPTALSAPSFAMAALPDDSLAQFQLDGRHIQVSLHSFSPGNTGPDTAAQFSGTDTVVLGAGHPPITSRGFKHYHPDARLLEGDSVVTLSVHRDATLLSSGQTGRKQPDKEVSAAASHSKLTRLFSPAVLRAFCREKLAWIQEDQIRRVAFICSAVIFLLLMLGGFLFSFFVQDMTLADSLYATVVLILGGYADLLGGDLHFEMPVPWWLRLFGLLLTISGTLFVGLVYAVFTQYLLSMRFNFKRDVPVPESGHVIVYGVKKVGLVVVEQLERSGQAPVGIDEKKSVDKNFSYVPLNGQSVEHALIRANVSEADSLIALARDELENLEVGLLARSLAPDIKLVIRTHDSQFSKRLSVLWPKAHILSTASLAAEALAAASFGENVPFLFRVAEKTILVTEYRVEPGDTLVNRTVGSFSNAFGVQPLLLKKKERTGSLWLPSDDNLLQSGDTFYVLATIDSIKRIEHGQPLRADYRLFVEKPLNDVGLFEGANALSRLTGDDISECRSFMKELPAVYPRPVYLHQGIHMVASLKKSMVGARLEKSSEQCPDG